jgi:hypothetical protein
MSTDKTIQLAIKLPMAGLNLEQNLMEDDDSYFNRIISGINFVDVLKGRLGEYRSCISVMDESGTVFWRDGGFNTPPEKMGGA